MIFTRGRAVWWSVGTVVVAGVVAFFVARLTITAGLESRKGAASEQSFHQWLHDNLEITEEQESKLLPHEKAYEVDRKKARKDIEIAGAQLAEVIRDHEADSSEVDVARRRLSNAQEELQRLTLDHFFAMKEYLDPEQGEKLLEWTHDSILHGHGD